VIGGDYVVGLFVCSPMLMIINFMVITKGAGRMSEVSARFILDCTAGQADGNRRRSQRRDCCQP
jgi:flagellar biosynthesis protein FlhA